MFSDSFFDRLGLMLVSPIGGFSDSFFDRLSLMLVSPIGWV